VLLLLGVLGSLVAAGVSLVGLLTPSPVVQDLVERGVVPPGASVQAFHDHSAAADGSSGCLLADDVVVRFDAGAVTGRVPAAGASVTVVERPLSVRVAGPEGAVDCPFGLGEGADTFAGVVRNAAERARAQAWRPVDPRVRHLYGSEAPD